MKRYLLAATAFLISVFLFVPLFADKNPHDLKTPPGFPVSVKSIELSEVGELLIYTGSIKPNMQANVFSNVDGRLDEVVVSGGESVKKGRVLGYVVNDTPGYRYVRHPVRAPFNGIVTKIEFDPGAAIRQSDALFEVTNLDTFYFLSYVPQRDAVRLKKGEPATVSLDAFDSDFEVSGDVVALGSVADEASGLVKLALELKPTDKPVKVGMTGEARLKINKHQGIVVPRDAIVWRNLKSFVFVVAPNDVDKKGDGDKKNRKRKGKKELVEKPSEDMAKFVSKLREVKLGTSAGDLVEVVDGVSAGEQIVVVGAGSLTDNRGIHLVESK